MTIHRDTLISIRDKPGGGVAIGLWALLAGAMLGWMPGAAWGGERPGWRFAPPCEVRMTGEMPALETAAAGRAGRPTGLELRGLWMIGLGAGGGWLPDAAEVTPEIAELAADLGPNPLRIFRFVREQIAFQPYYGSLKGAHGTLLDGAGNAWDQASLLVSLLRAAGFGDVRYVIGVVTAPDSSPNGHDLARWMGLPPALARVAVANTAAVYLAVPQPNGSVVYAMDHVWVRLRLGGLDYDLDPTYDRSEAVAGMDVPALAQWDRAGVMAAAGGQETEDYVEGVDAEAVRGELAAAAGRLRAALAANHPAATIEEIARGRRRLGGPAPTLGTAGPHPSFQPWALWTAERLEDIEAAKIQVRLGTAGPVTVRADILAGRRLTVDFDEQGRGRLWLGGELLAQEAAAVGSQMVLELALDHPRNTAAQANGGGPDWDVAMVPRLLPRGGGVYDITPSLAPWWRGQGRAAAARRQLAEMVEAGAPAGQVRAAALHGLGVEWGQQMAMAAELSAAVRGGWSFLAHTAGVSGQEESLFVDMPLVSGVTAGADGQHDAALMSAQVALASALEHAVVEQAGAPQAVSTVRALAEAARQGQRVYLAGAGNWAGVRAQLSGYSPPVLQELDADVAGGSRLLLHRDGATALGDWSGFGYALLAGNRASMRIAGALDGGYATSYLVVDGHKITLPPEYWQEAQSAGTPEALSAEPVDLRTGAYTWRKTDLELGAASTPRGLEFTRSYDSQAEGCGALGRGWTHSCHGQVRVFSSPAASFGLLRGRDAAPLLTAITALFEFFPAEHASSPRQALLWVLAAEWASEWLVGNCAAVELGSQRLLYTRREDGGWSRPPGLRAELEGGSGSFLLRPHLRGTIGFDSQNRIAWWDDPDGNRRSFVRDEHGRLQHVTDATGRSLTFHYAGTSPLIQSVADSTGRGVAFSYSSEGLLVAATDPAGHATTFGYDAAGRLNLWVDPLGRTVARNFYDERGRVVRQHSRGDPAQEWKFGYRPGASTETDPAGRITTWLFDRLGRLGAIRNPLGQEEIWLYDAANRLTDAWDAEGGRTRFFYDREDNLLAIEDPMGNLREFFYDALGRLTAKHDGTGVWQSFEHDEEHHVVAAADSSGNTTTFSCRPDGLLASVTDPMGRSTTYSYDPWGNVVGVLRPDGNSTAATYNARGDKLSHTDALGHTTTYTYDARRLLTSTTDALGHTTHLHWDAAGHPSGATDRLGHTTHAPTDSFGRLLRMERPATAPITYAYDERDLLVAVSDGNSTTTTSYDPAGRAAAITDGLGHSTTFSRDAVGRPTAVTDGSGRSIQHAYDAAGRLISSSEPSTGLTVNRTYDAAGRLLAITNAAGATFSLAYNHNGQSAGMRRPTGRANIVNWWDDCGRPTEVIGPGGRFISLDYDALGRLTASHDMAGSVSFRYDAEGRLLEAREGNATVSRAYDGLGRVVSCTDNLGQTVGYLWDAEGRLRQLEYPGGLRVQYEYDAAGRLVGVRDWAGRQTTLSYDGQGRLSAIERPNGTRALYEWDAAGRLRGLREMRAAATLWRARLERDGAGRLVRADTLPPTPGVGQPAVGLSYDADNRLVAFNGWGNATDEHGQMRLVPRSWGGGLAPLGWDGRGRLIEAWGAGGQVLYQWDCENRRASKTTAAGTTTYTWDRGMLDRLLAVRHPDGSTTRYIYGVGLLYEEHTPAGGGAPVVRFYHYDWLGSTVALSDAAGQVTARVAYSAYGRHEVVEGVAGTPFLFQGRWGVLTEPETGLLHMMARFYSPELGRFLSEDPAGLAGGLNLYAFAGGDPANFFDPFGLGPVDVAGWHAFLADVFLNSEAWGALSELWILSQYYWATGQHLHAGGAILVLGVGAPLVAYDTATNLAAGKAGLKAGVKGFKAVKATAELAAKNPEAAARLLAEAAANPAARDAARVTPNVRTGAGYGVNDPAVRIQGTWTEADFKAALQGKPPASLGRPDLHHADQMPGSAIHEVLPAQHRGNPALHPNTFNQGVTPQMRTQDRQLHWWYRAREHGADQLYPDLIYD